MNTLQEFENSDLQTKLRLTFFCVELTTEKDSDGKHEIRDHFFHYPMSCDYIPITEAEYRAAVEPILNAIRERAGL